MYSSGLNNYLKFSNGEGFERDRKQLELLDIEIAASEQIVSEKILWKHSGIIKKQAIESARYRC